MLTLVEETARNEMTVTDQDPEVWTGGWPQSAAEFEALISVFQHRLVRYAFRRLKNLHDAEDVAQEVFVRAFQQRAELRSVTRVAPYLYRMAANLCTDRHRRPKPVQLSIDEPHSSELQDGRAGPRERALAAQDLLRADELLSHLPAEQAEVLLSLIHI